MTESKATNELKDYAGGWIQEKQNTTVPTFLKFAYIVIAGGAFVYPFIFMNGEVDHATRGTFVRQFNAATQSSSGFMYFVAALIAIFAIITIKFAFSKSHED